MSERRKLSKAERNALWVMADGRCWHCGAVLTPDFHAHHAFEPFWKSGDTNIHELRAVCPPCNLTIGGKMLRPPQQRLDEFCRQITVGIERRRNVLVDSTPGSGKSTLPQIMGNHLKRAGLIDDIFWVVPRVSLQEQGASDFEDKFFRDLIGHNMSIRETTAMPDPCRGTAGCVVTYAAVAADGASKKGSIFKQMFDRRRVLLCLDEIQHVHDGSATQNAIQYLYDMAPYRLLMSGTLETNTPGSRIAFIRYGDPEMTTIIDPLGNPRQKRLAPVLLTDDDDWKVIRYTRREALSDGVLIPTHFRLVDGSAKYVDRDGQTQDVKSLSGEMDYQLIRDGLYAAVNTSYAHDIMAATFDHFNPYREIYNPEGKALIVAAFQGNARDYLKWVRSAQSSLRVGLAISDESSEAKENIRRFKLANKDRNALDVLVTVAMCYEGMSVPNATHLAALTLYRSKPWLEQMFARISRSNRKNQAKTRCYAFVPDDPFMAHIINTMKADQPPVADELMGGGGGGGGGPQGQIAPIESEAIDRRESGDGAENDEIDYEETRKLDEAAREEDIRGVSAIQLKRFLKRYESQQAQQDESRPPQTPAMMEKALKDRIEDFCRKHDVANGLDWGTTNGRIVKVFNKKRPDMTFAELGAVWKWLQKECGAPVMPGFEDAGAW